MNRYTPLVWFRLLRTEMKATIRLSIPIVIGQLGIILMGVIDTLMLGRVSTTAIAASGASNNVFFLVTILGIGALAVVSPLVASADERKDKATCHLLLRSSLWMSIGLGVVLMLIQVVLTYYFEIFRQEAVVTTAAKTYLFWINFSIIPMMVFLGCKQFTDGVSATKVGMIVTWVGFAVNVVANGLLIFGHVKGAPNGLEGAGLGTLIARVVMMLLLLLYLIRHSTFKVYLQAIYTRATLLPRIKQLLKMGTSTAFAYFFESAAFATAGLLIGGFFGKEPQAAHQIAISVASITYMVISGLGVAGAIRVGQGFGTMNYAKLLKAGTTALAIGGVLMLVFCLLLISFPSFLVTLFLDFSQPNKTEVITIATTLMILAGFFQLSDGIQAVALGILRGIGDVRIPMIITFTAYWILGIPMGLLLGVVFEWGVVGIWWGLTAGLTFSALFLTLRFYKMVAKMRREATLALK